ncbi:MAG: ribonuclease HI [Polyangiales bacterium]
MSDDAAQSPPPPKVTIYTDGGAKPNPGGAGGWAAVLLSGNGKELPMSGGEPSTTNNRMELLAAISALEALKRPCEVTLYTDSEYLKNGITEWLPNWVARGWRTASKKPVKNQDLWERLHAATKPHAITWRWVKAHNGNHYNEKVDQMATDARLKIEAESRRARLS